MARSKLCFLAAPHDQPSLAHLNHLLYLNQQRGPGALRPQEDNPSHYSMQIAPHLARFRANGFSCMDKVTPGTLKTQAPSPRGVGEINHGALRGLVYRGQPARRLAHKAGSGGQAGGRAVGGRTRWGASSQTFGRRDLAAWRPGGGWAAGHRCYKGWTQLGLRHANSPASPTAQLRHASALANDT